ncbi:MAG: MGMT family protein [Patescibacteria group bacterium]
MGINFFQRVYDVVQRIPVGKVATYGLIADLIGTKDARRIGQALHANPDSSHTPCHRVVFADGRLAPGYAFGGINEQKRKLQMEGISFTDTSNVDLARFLWKPTQSA